MIQFNLLPAVKLEFVRARRNKRLTLLGAGTVSAVSLLILVLLFVSVQFQAKHSSDLTKDIKTQSKKLKETEDISSILTIQNQLNSLSTLHASKPEAARVFDYLKQVTPAGVTIANVEVDFEASTIKIKGSAPTISAVNTYVDTLKFTTYKVADDDSKQGNAFSEVVLGTIGTNGTDGTIGYDLSFKFESTIFSNVSAVALTVPNQVTTRSQLDKPNALFDSQGAQ